MGSIAGEIVLKAVFFLYPLWRIFRQAGFKPAWALLVFVPLIGPALVILTLALVRWPVHGPYRAGGSGSAT